MFHRTSRFSLKGQTTLYGNVTVALNNFNFEGVKSCAVLRRQLQNHPMSFAMAAIGTWLDVLGSETQLTEMKRERLKFDALEDIRDESVLPLYFDSEPLRQAIHPSVLQAVSTFGCVVRYLLGEDVDLAGSWQEFAAFVRDGEVVRSDKYDVWVLGSIAIAAKVKGKVEQVREVVAEELKRAAERLETELAMGEWPEFLGRYRDEQRRRIEVAVEAVLKFMQ
jgi:hypothetical protein